MIVAALAILGLVLGGGVIGWHAHALAQPWRPAPLPAKPSATVQSIDAQLKAIYPPNQPKTANHLARQLIASTGEGKQMRLARQLAEQSMLAALYRSCALSGEKPRDADVELAEVRRTLGHSDSDPRTTTIAEVGAARRQEGPTS